MTSIALKSVDNHSLFSSPPATSFGRRSFEQVAAQLQGVHFSRCWTHWWNVSTSKANHVPPGDEDQVDPLAQYTSPTICPTSSKPLAPEGYERAVSGCFRPYPKNTSTFCPNMFLSLASKWWWHFVNWSILIYIFSQLCIQGQGFQCSSYPFHAPLLLGKAPSQVDNH